MCDANNARHVEAAAPSLGSVASLSPSINPYPVPEMPVLDITLIPEEDFLAFPSDAVNPVPSSSDLSNFNMYVDQPSFNPNFDHSILNENYISENFIRDIFHDEGL